MRRLKPRKKPLMGEARRSDIDHHRSMELLGLVAAFLGLALLAALPLMALLLVAGSRARRNSRNEHRSTRRSGVDHRSPT
ncbi:hypothetical protein DFQ14_101624 [Halopolyspora algeriensis]|uniref:Uncharacterized protein n=1 Tax=Halopolyspora algeriensis TaxID=1500506 RepID=A0A368VZE5_9ACTN|nr:hypothetical protein DFQ14_101624 [Halopolyspora algeriensis]TQM42511.1 hypothetical protein FHU43_4142 [Halopolyspora algeriensis]